MVGVSCQDDIFVGKRVTPLLHLQWTASVDIHLVVLGGAPWWATVVTPQGVFAEAQIRVLLVGICRFATATALLLLWGSRQVPGSFLNPQERERVARQRLDVSEFELGPSLLCSFFIVLEGPLWSLNGCACNEEVRGDVGISLLTCCVLMQCCCRPLIQVISLLEAEAVLSKVPSDGKGGWSPVNHLGPPG